MPPKQQQQQQQQELQKGTKNLPSFDKCNVVDGKKVLTTSLLTKLKGVQHVTIAKELASHTCGQPDAVTLAHAYTLSKEQIVDLFIEKFDLAHPPPPAEPPRPKRQQPAASGSASSVPGYSKSKQDEVVLIRDPKVFDETGDEILYSKPSDRTIDKEDSLKGVLSWNNFVMAENTMNALVNPCIGIMTKAHKDMVDVFKNGIPVALDTISDALAGEMVEAVVKKARVSIGLSGTSAAGAAVYSAGLTGDFAR